MHEITQKEWEEAISTPVDLVQMEHLIQEFNATWDEYELKRKAASAAFSKFSEVEKKILDVLKTSGKTVYQSEEGTVSIQRKAVVTVPNTHQAKEKFFSYLKALGRDVLYSLVTVNSNSLNAWYNTQMEQAFKQGSQGFSVPGISEPTMRETIHYRKGSKKHGSKASSNNSSH